MVKNIPKQDFGIVACIAILVRCQPNKRELDKISYLIGTYKLLRRDNFSLYLLPFGQIAGNFLLLVGDSGKFHLTF